MAIIIGKEEIKYSLRNLSHRKMRSFLTVLSIFVGITTIFIFVSYGIGLQSYVNDFVTETTADKLTIMPRGAGPPGLDDTFALTESDLRAIQQTSGVYEASGNYIKTAEIKKGDQKIYSFVIGYDPKTPIIWEMFGNLGLYKGRWLKSGDNRKVILGYNYHIKDRIFKKPLDINDKIEIQGEDYRIVSFYDEVGNPQDDSQVYMTNDELFDLFEGDVKGYNMIVARVDITKIDNIIERVEKRLRNSRDLEKGKEDFFVQSWNDLLETYSQVLNGISAFVIIIALFAMVVSAINTANTMITSVLERTREIGIMKAVGATNSGIFNIFLFESGFLGFVAGVAGVLFGYIITSGTDAALKASGWGFLTPFYSTSMFIGLIVFATLTGAISGAWPAIKASRINPVEALRYE